MKVPVLLVLASLIAAAQNPPPILRIIRNPNPHSNQPYAKASAAIEVLGLQAVTGVGETWLIEQHPTFQSIEDLDKALRSTGGDPSNWLDPQGATADEVLGSGRAMIAYYKDGWGHHSEDAVRMLPRTRYFNITIYRLRAGESGDSMGNILRGRYSRLDSMNLNQPELVYHVISGGPPELYIVLAPMTSLRTMDDRITKMPLEVESGSTSTALAGRETLMFRIAPAISYVSDEFAAVDKSFWRGQ
jgi:hypothetical protein